jgi:PhnB protein
MTTKVKFTPEGSRTATPYLIIGGAANAIEFYKTVFGATEEYRMTGQDGRIGHAIIHIGDSRIMMADEFPELGYRGPLALGGTAMSILLYVEDVDTVFNRAIAAGAKEFLPVKDQFYGDRNGTLKDPFGHQWTIATHIEDVTPEEVEKRVAVLHAKK